MKSKDLKQGERTFEEPQKVILDVLLVWGEGSRRNLSRDDLDVEQFLLGSSNRSLLQNWRAIRSCIAQETLNLPNLGHES